MIDRKTLAAIRPATDGKTHFLPDGAVGGLGVLWGATGKPSWTLAYRVGGRQIRAKLGFCVDWRGGEGPAGVVEHRRRPGRSLPAQGSSGRGGIIRRRAQNLASGRHSSRKAFGGCVGRVS